MAGISIGIINKNYISALDPSLDVRDIDPTVYDVAREDSFTDLLQIGDRKEPVTQPFFVSWTNTKLFYKGVAGTVTNNNTAAVTVALTADTSNEVRIGTIAYLKDGTSGIVTSVTTAAGVDTIIIKTDNGTLAIAENDEISFGGIIAGERSIAPKNARYGYTKYSNKIGIYSEVSQITDIQAAGKLEAEIDGNDTFVFKDHIDKLKVLKGSMNFEFLMSDISTTNFADTNPTLVDPNVNTSGGGGAVQRGRGLYKYTTTYGTSLQAVGSGTSGSPVPNGVIGEADLDNVCDALTASRAPDKIMALTSSAVKRSFDKFFKNLNSSGVNSVRLMVSGKEMDLQVDEVSYGGKTFVFTPMGIMDHPNTTGTIIGKTALFMPYDFRVPVYSDGTSQEKPGVGMRYIPSMARAGNELIGETYTGANAPYPNGEVQEWRTIWVAKASLECKAPSFNAALQVLS